MAISPWQLNVLGSVRLDDNTAYGYLWYLFCTRCVIAEECLPGDANIHVKAVVPQFDRIAGDPDGLTMLHLSGGDVEAPAVPRAGDHVSLQRALTQWASPVDASIVDSV